MTDPLKHEQIMLALLPVLVAGFAGTTRNTPLPDLNSGGQIVRLQDGPIEAGDLFLNPPMYEFTATPTVLILVADGDTDADRDASVAAIVADLNARLAAVTDLGGLITDLRMQPPNYAPRELWGAQNMKGAEFGIEIDFWSTTSAG